MFKNFKKRFMSGAGAIALSLGFVTVAGVQTAQAAMEHPHMDFEISCSDDGRTATVSANTWNLGNFQSFSSSDDRFTIHEITQVITVNGEPVAQTERIDLLVNEPQTYTIDLPAGDFKINGYHTRPWYENENGRFPDLSQPNILGEAENIVFLNDTCGWSAELVAAVAVAPTFTAADECGVEGAVTVPEVEGVTYAQNREGDIVTVTATADSGFFFDEKETTSWEFNVAAEACEVVETPTVEPMEPPVTEEKIVDQAPVAQVVAAEQAMLAETGSASVFGVLASGFLLLGAGTVLIARRKQGSNI